MIAIETNGGGRDAVYAALESQMVAYGDLLEVPVEPNGELLVPLANTETLVAYQLRAEMLPITGEAIYVRQTVRDMLGAASLRLAVDMPGAQLQVGYGYRALSVQRAGFEGQRARLRGSVPDMQLDEAAHRFVAKPEIAGHPTGGAVDVRMVLNGGLVDCGTGMWELEKDSYTFTPYVGRQARDARMQLRAAMLAVGFAPFDGEWWHYSYGDREWAYYYGKPAALYEQVEFSTITTRKV